MKPVFSAGLLLFMACMGATSVRSPVQWLSLVALLVGGLVALGASQSLAEKGHGGSRFDALSG